MSSWLRHRRLLWALPIVVAAIVATVAACNRSPSESGSPTSPSSPANPDNPTNPTNPGNPVNPGAKGVLAVKVTDSPFGDATALLVTFSEVSAHASGGDWATLPFADGGGTRTCDIKRLVGAQDVLGTGPLAAGHYTQLRLAVSSAAIYFKRATTGPVCAATLALQGGAETGTPVDIPSGVLHLNREFDLPASGATTILLDFDGDKSVLKTGNGAYKMLPVVGIVSVQ